MTSIKVWMIDVNKKTIDFGRLFFYDVKHYDFSYIDLTD